MKILKSFIIAVLIAVLIGYNSPIKARVVPGNVFKGACFQDGVCCSKTVIMNDKREHIPVFVFENNKNKIHSSTCSILRDIIISKRHNDLHVLGVVQPEIMDFVRSVGYVLCDVCNGVFTKCTLENPALCCRWFEYVVEEPIKVFYSFDEMKKSAHNPLLHLVNCDKLINKDIKLYSSLSFPCKICFPACKLLDGYETCHECLPVDISGKLARKDSL